MQRLYSNRQVGDTNEGRRPHAACPCLMLLHVYEDETFDAWRIVHMLCPSCAAGWVREEAYSDVR